MAQAADYGLGPEIFPKGWFIIASSKELNKGPMAVRYFGKDFALYRGESGNPVLLDAYCKHMGTHLAGGSSAMIVKNGQQIEGDSIRCPYHGWRYASDGTVDDIPYHDGPCPKSASIQSYPVKDVMGCVMMWHDPHGGEPEYEPPFLKEWDDTQWMQWDVQDLGKLNIHGIEILDNMADARHLGPTHGAPCEYFENEFRDHVVIQRQGGFMQLYDAQLDTTTWYTGPGILLSRQEFGPSLIYELIANVPVEDGVTQAWHGTLVRAMNNPPTKEDWEMSKEADAGALEAFSADFVIWSNKKPALKVMQLKTDGPFNKVRKWYSQFYASPDEVKNIRAELNGTHADTGLPNPSKERREVEDNAKIWA